MAAFSILQLALNFEKGLNYQLVAVLVISFWCVSFLVMHQLKLAIELSGLEKVQRTLDVFFIVNAAISAFDLLKIMYTIQDLNPYTFDGLSYKYSASTGDYIKGISRDLSTVNMICNAFGLIYYFIRRKYVLASLCFIVAVFTTSNLGNLILFFFFIYVLIFDKIRFNKSVVLCYVAFIVLFIVKISPSNLNYMNHKFKELLHLKEPIVKVHFEDNTEKDELINRYIYKYHREFIEKQTNQELVERINSFNKDKDSIPLTDSLYVSELSKIHTHFADYYTSMYGDTNNINRGYYYGKPGKLLSFYQTGNFMANSPKHFLIGAGGANYSSKLAYKASNVGVSGKYIKKYAYLSPYFKQDHLKLSMTYYLQSATEHSIINSPNSTLNQLLGEYGLLGILLFLIFYLWYFVKRLKSLTYSRLLIPICLLFMLTDYWFESFSILIIFELMVFLDLEQNKALANE
jgi:hypothetical protein